LQYLDERSRISLIEGLRRRVGKQGYLRALRDGHAKRRPRPCGLTVHSGIGCDALCKYCYIQDLGFEFTRVKPYHLTGDELVLALLLNRFFKPGREGTFLAFGSVTDPLHQACIERTKEYLAAIERFLGNPCQFSTKRRAPADFIDFLRKLKVSVSPLITLVSLKMAEVLEPNAPPPSERLDFIRELRNAGLKPMLFLRPLIPGIVDKEIDDILDEAKSAGAVGVVAGALRVSPLILSRMKKAGINLAEIKRRIKRREGKFLLVDCSDLKKKTHKIAEEKGLIFFNSACCASAYTAGVLCMGRCWEKKICTKCPNKCYEKIKKTESAFKAA